MTQRELVIGIDGGGTGTRVWLAEVTDQSVDVIGKGNSGVGNLQTNPSEALEHLHDAVTNAFEQANLNRQTVAAACVCMAGSGRPESKQRVHRWSDDVQLARSVLVTNDALPILYAVDDSAYGVALISGTGSFAFGRNREGRTSRSGGWGPILGDEGSGYAIAREALRAAVRYSDGRDAATDLLPRLIDHLELTEASDLVSLVHSDDFNRVRLAAIASKVFESCDDGDTVARQIVRDAAGELAMAAAAVINNIDLPREDFRLALAGGVLVNQPTLRQSLNSAFADLGYRPSSTSVIDQPVLGAVRIAANHLRSDGTPNPH